MLINMNGEHRLGDTRKCEVPRVNAIPGLEAKRRYLLEVQIEVAITKKNEFTKIGKQFLDAFKQEQLTLAVSAWQPDGGPFTAVNYWDMGNDANVLLAAELALPDIPGFTAFNDLIENEVKNIVVPIASGQSNPITDDLRVEDNKLSHERWRYLRVTASVPTRHLIEFQFRVEESLMHFATAHGWLLGDTYLGITGPEGFVSQIWIIPATDAFDVGTKLAGAPWLRAEIVPKGPRFRIMRATKSDPTLASEDETIE